MIRVFHGFSTGFLPTGAVAYIADIVPSDRRGEAMGVAGIMNNIGFMAGNAVSSLITEVYGINNLFYFSGIIAIVSIAILLKLPETIEKKQKMKWKHLKINKDDIYDSRVISPAIVMILTTLTFGTVLTLIPDYSKGLGIMNKGLFLTIATISTVAVRIYAGKLSDRIGRLRTSIIGTIFWILTTICLASLNIKLFYLGAVLMGTATGMNSPAIFAWVVDIADGVKSGRAMATLFISMEIGIATGAFLSAWIYGNIFDNLRWVFVFLTIANLVALLYLIRTKRLSAAKGMS
ncbi:MFS transporter [bacterium]|nr:MFS transporter [bacterium]